MQDGILTERNGAVLEVTIDRPKANAIDLAASRRLNDVFTQFRDDASLRVAIITGAGDRFFSPGWDLKAAAGGEESDSDWGAGGFGGLNYPRNLNKPIVAAVNGIACGGGFEIVLGTDIIVMEEHARFALPEINVAVLADAGTIKLRRRIPYHVAVEFLMTGRWMDAAEAKHWGLANHVVPKGQGLAKAREIAQQLAAGPPLLFPAIKQLLRHTEMVPEHEAFELHDSLHLVQQVVRSEDLKEGTRAFTEKRKPRWTGSLAIGSVTKSCWRVRGSELERRLQPSPDGTAQPPISGGPTPADRRRRLRSCLRREAGAPRRSASVPLTERYAARYRRRHQCTKSPSSTCTTHRRDRPRARSEGWRIRPAPPCARRSWDRT